jgi:hypothetical protein
VTFTYVLTMNLAWAYPCHHILSFFLSLKIMSIGFTVLFSKKYMKNIDNINPLYFPSPHCNQPLNRTYLLFLSFIFSIYVNCSKEFQHSISHIHILHFKQISSLYYSLSLPPIPHYSTVFTVFCYAFFIQRCNVF